MKPLTEFLRDAWRRVTRRPSDEEMEEELRFHIEMRARRHQENGMAAEAARELARRSFGHIDGVREACRDERRFEWVRQAAKDARYGWRAMMRVPGPTAAAALALGVGVGLMSVELSFVRGVSSHLPVRDSERVLEIQIATREGFMLGGSSIALKDYEAWRAVQKSFGVTGAVSRATGLDVSGPGLYARSYLARGITAGALRVLEAKPELGRGFTPDDERASAPLTVILSHEVWKRDFGGAPDILGRRIRARSGLREDEGTEGVMPAEEATIIGVMPAGFALDNDNIDCWLNMAGRGPVTAVARIRDGVRPETASAELATQGRGFEAPEGVTVRGLAGKPMSGSGAGRRLRVLLATLFGVVAAVMALACVNVATLLLLRALERGRELALRMALGATRGRLVRQLLVESALLAVLAAAVGVPLAWAGAGMLDRQLAADPSKPAWIRLELDGAALAAILAASLLAALAAGLAPALRAARLDANEALKNGGWGSGARLGRFTRWTVAFQSAAACALLLVTGLLVNSLLRFGRCETPYDPERMMSVTINAQRYRSEQAATLALERAAARIRSLPGVEAAALTSARPLDKVRTGRVPGKAGEFVYAGSHVVSPEYFDVVRAPIREGRGFTSADRQGGEPVAVVSESLARLLWPGRSALGQQIRDFRDASVTVVGVCADVPLSSNSARSTARDAAYFEPMAQQGGKSAYVALRSAVDPGQLIRPIRQAVQALDPDMPADGFVTSAELNRQFVATPRALGALAAVFALSALALAAVGIYGVTSFSVRKRTREFGIRVALGASPLEMARLTLGRGLLQLAVSLSIGGLLGWFASRPMLHTLEGMAPKPATLDYAVIVVVVALATFSALWLPARHATKVDPVETLRSE
jgi:putative ABC transport system permease protein